MASYSVNLPLQLQEEVEKCALDQGIPPDQFILWAVAEKVAVLQHQFHDRSFPHITYRTGASGSPVAVIREEFESRQLRSPRTNGECLPSSLRRNMG
ncbi:hypothetical protein [Planktothricoides sp. SR001]|uniref:hypothetical protein n=1 Tax=Planktothricoides sp. SR001 TaxID=1705388 RepID=UPI001E2EE2E2|nr:hypothetical protein [Planktothricoides sp. SR001]